MIAVIFLAGGFFARQYFATPKENLKDETAGWKTYRNEEDGFEIKYPERLRYGEDDSGQYSPSRTGKSIFFAPKEMGADWIVMINFPTNTTPEEVLKMALDSNTGPDLIITTEKLFGFDGKVAIYNHKVIKTDRYKDIVFKKGEVIFHLTGLVDSYNTPEDAVFNQMLSTFRFLE